MSIYIHTFIDTIIMAATVNPNLCLCRTANGQQCSRLPTRDVGFDHRYCKQHQHCKTPIIIRAPKPSQSEEPSTLTQTWLPHPIEYYSTEMTYGEYILPLNPKFPDWIVKRFNKYLMVKDVPHSCDPQSKHSGIAFLHQQFIADYMSPDKPYRGLLLYHDLGSGKTRSAVMVAEQYRALGTKVLVILPASLKQTWLNEIKTWGNPDIRRPDNYEQLSLEEKTRIDHKINRLITFGYDFVTANASNTHEQLREAIGPGKLSHRLVIVDEVHNLISRIMSSSKSGAEKADIGLQIYEMLMNVEDCKFLFLSATPVLNTPYELALMFNILKGYINYNGQKITLFPEQIETFDSMFVTETSNGQFKIKNSAIFQRRIIGMVSYYYSGEGDVYPQVFHQRVNCSFYDQLESEEDISPQLHNYLSARFREIMSEMIVKRKKQIQSMQSRRDLELLGTFKLNPKGNFRVRSRLACNFGFPPNLNPPRSSGESWDVIRLKLNPDPKLWTDEQVKMFKSFLPDDDIYQDFVTSYASLTGETARYNFLVQQFGYLTDDFDFQSVINSELAFTQEELDVPRTYEDAVTQIKGILEDKYGDQLMNNLDKFSPKMSAIIRTIESQPDELCFIYSNYVTLEGIGIMTVVLKLHGFEPLPYNMITEKNIQKYIREFTDDYKGRFVAYTGSEDPLVREKILRIFRHKLNRNGAICRIFLGSPAAAEGLSLKNVRQVHIMEPHWNNVRIQQVIGRARRICSHFDLEPEKRNIKVYHYFMTFSPKLRERIAKVTKKHIALEDVTSDELIDRIAQLKESLNNQFLQILKNSAVDCLLNLVHNKTEQNPIECYRVPEGETGPTFSLEYKQEKSDTETSVKYKTIKIPYQVYKGNPDYVVKITDDRKGYKYERVKVLVDPYKDQIFNALVLYYRKLVEESNNFVPGAALVIIDPQNPKKALSLKKPNTFEILR